MSMNKIPILVAVISTICLPATAESVFIKPMIMPTVRLTTVKPLFTPAVKTTPIQTVKPIQSVKPVNQNSKKTNVEPERVVKEQESYAVTAENCTCEHASQLYSQGKYKEAAFYYNKTAEIMIRQYKHENSDIANMRYGQGICFYMLEDYPQADKWLTASLNMYKRVKDTSNSAAVAMAVLGDSSNRQDKYTIGDRLIKDAIALLTQKQQQKSSDYEYCVSLLATSYDWQDRQEEALPLLKQSLALKKQLKLDAAEIKETQKQIEEDMKTIESRRSLLKKSTA